MQEDLDAVEVRVVCCCFSMGDSIWCFFVPVLMRFDCLVFFVRVGTFYTWIMPCLTQLLCNLEPHLRTSLLREIQ